MPESDNAFMSKPISLFDTPYESLVDQLVEKDGEFVLRTLDQRFFRLNPASGRLLQRIEAGDLNAEDSGQAESFVDQVLLAKGIYQRPGENATRTAKAPGLSWHLPVFSAKQVNRLAAALATLLSPFVALPLLALCVYAQGQYLWSHAQYFSYDYLFSFTPSQLAWLLVASLATSFFHELGHATACRRYAGKTGEIGLGINVVVPVFFANVSNLYLVGRRHRLIIGVSGLYFQVVFATVILLMGSGQAPVEKYLMINALSMLINTIPLFRNDGYWVLNDLLGRRDLLTETAARWFGRGRIGWVDVAYGALFVVFAGGMLWLIGRFIGVRGPELIAEVMLAPELTFTVATRSLLVGCQYLAITMGLFLLIRQGLTVLTRRRAAARSERGITS